jgi:beta-glucosidase
MLNKWSRGLMILLLSVLAILINGCNRSSTATPAYKNADLPVQERVNDLLSRMTPEEKFWQLYMIPGDLDGATPGQYKNGLFGFQVSAATTGDNGAAQQVLSYNNQKEDAYKLAQKVNRIQRYFVEETRLGIPLLFFDEALHGLVREGATSFPQAIALAASFDTVLMRRVSGAIADEAKQRGIRQILSPVVNLASDVRWGRTEETYGEDPFLVSEMGVAFVSSFEQRNIITTPKHFLANVGDGGRDSYPIHTSERLLEETQLLPFKACFERGGSRSVMTAYNSLNGEACSANEWLLREKLKEEWKFKGFVISDAAATGGSFVLHNTTASYPESGAQAINNGLDVIFQTEYKHHELFDPHFYDGVIDKGKIDEAVARVLRAKFELGLFDHPYIDENAARSISNNKPLAREAAMASMVLLKNENKILPLAPTLNKIALIGTDAKESRLGGYSGPGNGKVSIEEGLRERLGTNATILFAEGPGRNEHSYQPLPKQVLWHKKNNENRPGLAFDVFDNIDLKGVPVETGIDESINKKWTLSRPSSRLKKDFYSVRWEGILKPADTDYNKIGLEGNDGYRLYLNDQLVIDNWAKRSYHTKLIDYTLKSGEEYRIRIEFFEPVSNGQIRLVWDKGDNSDQKINEAVALAKASAMAVIVAGIEEGEFRDRASLSLPGRQEELINRVAKTGVPVVVVLIGGSAIVMNNWIENVDGILHAWYPGEEGGHAIASVLLGDFNPAGRLPISFPVSESQLPLVYNHKPTGRGDDYVNLTGRPLFPFGFGLSYTSFQYENIRLEKDTSDATKPVKVFFTLKNSGAVQGEEVAQLYIKDNFSSLSQPVIALKGFKRVMLKAGESKELSFEITPQALQLLNKEMKWVVEPGDFSIMIGASSADIRLRTTLVIR